LLTEQDLADLLSGAREAVTVERLLRLEPKDVESEVGTIWLGDLAWLPGGDARLDILGQLTALPRSEIAAVLRRRVAGVLPGELREVSALAKLAPDQLGTDAGGLPRRVARSALGHHEDMARVIGESRLELRAVLVEILIDLRLRHGD